MSCANTHVFALFIVIFLAGPVFAWNVPIHMITGAMAHRLLQSQNPQAAVVRASITRKAPLVCRPLAGRKRKITRNTPKRCSCGQRVGPMTFGRKPGSARSGLALHLPFKPDREPEHIKPLPPHRENILTAIAENKRIVGESIEPGKRTIALAWLFHSSATCISRCIRSS